MPEPPLAWPAVSGGRLIVRDARPEDLPAVVRLIHDDLVGRRRERPEEPLADGYLRALEAISADPRNRLVVAEIEGEDGIAGCMQITFIPGIAMVGGERAQIEAVRVASGVRGRGVGTRFMRWAIEEARARGCALVQLTTDKRRVDAARFYRRLGFEPTHEGMKLPLRDLDDAEG